MITREFADRFARDWIAAWNSHNLDRVLAHYTDDFEMSSPYIVQIAAEPSGKLRGKAAVSAYWSKALQLIPDLHFELHATLLGSSSVVIYYRGAKGMAAEVFEFDGHGKVTKAGAHYV